MYTAEHVTTTLTQRGLRLTPVRRALIDIFCTASLPLTVQELLDVLAARVRQVNKTTVYREVEFLISQGFVQEFQLGASCRYEVIGHHHHLLCERCQTVQCVEFPEVETVLESSLGQVADRFNFQANGHILTITGRCISCSSKT